VSVFCLVLVEEILDAAHQIIAEAQFIIRGNALLIKEIVQMVLVTPKLVGPQANATVQRLAAYALKPTNTAAHLTSVNVKRDTSLTHRFIGVVMIKTLMTGLHEAGKVIPKTKVDVLRVMDVHSRIV
jgi:hypothetical protein